MTDNANAKPAKSLADFKSKAPSAKPIPKPAKGATAKAIKAQAKGDW